MLWMAISLLFFYCAFREILRNIVAPPGYAHPTPVSKSYLAVVLTLALLFAWPPFHTWHFERFLSATATELAEGHRATVHCNTIFDTMHDTEVFAAAYTNPRTGAISIQHPWCGTLMSYLDHPNRATPDELMSLDIITHESMHVRGEINEAKTECEAVQRNYRAAKLMGVSDITAKTNAIDYYDTLYKQRGVIGGMQAAYYSTQCTPGGVLDEQLRDSTWTAP